MAITAAEGVDGFTSKDATLSLTFTSSEVTTDFAEGDITVTNGALSDFAATSSTVYTATFTPTASGAATIDVAANGFTDASSNNNTAASQFNWTYDGTVPTISSVSLDADNLTIAVTMSEAVYNTSGGSGVLEAEGDFFFTMNGGTATIS
ncbi:MAG: Ig-like domain-containing protein, partial [Candidatus Marinimicrobia bacterium]|nr:Ig-like domain-containing protein [Candidatus Neomarinimicrobiota bacterium]